MKRSSYRDRDYAFGQMMLTLRSATGLTQTSLAEFLGVSRRAVGDWEAGNSYPKANHLKKFIMLVVEHRVFREGEEAEEIRSLWKNSHQKVRLDETWLSNLLEAQSKDKSRQAMPSVTVTENAVKRDEPKGSQSKLNNLPFQPTPFVGRKTDLNEIARILSDPHCRLLTLLGPGGVGKTRLALEAAEYHAMSHSEAAVFVPLSSVSTPKQIPSAIAEALKLPLAGQRDITQYLLNYLKDQNLLLILDNFEHLLSGFGLIYDMMEHAPQVTILITSRTRLSLQAEWLFDVQGLAYPSEVETLQGLGDLTEYDAVNLFVQRVKQIQPDFPLLKSTLTSIARICQQLSGMPLAIELAAAHIRTIPIAKLEQQLRISMDTLATQLHDVPFRHRSIRAVFDHSWNLLNEAERTLLSRLSVFRGGWMVNAAKQVTGATLPLLRTLVDKSLVQEIPLRMTSNGDTSGEGNSDLIRFGLLEPIREYALEKLTQRGEFEALQLAHAQYYLAFVEAKMAQWDASAIDPVIDQINRDLNNIRAVLEWARTDGSSTLGLQLAGTLWRFWRSSGHTTEGRLWLDELLALQEQSEDKSAMSARLLAMHVAAWLASDQHDYTLATQLFEQTVPLRRALGETEADTHLLHNLALQARADGHYEQAIALLEEALERNRALSTSGMGTSLYEMGFSLYGLGLLHREQGDFPRARLFFEESLQFHHEIGDRESMAQALLGLGDIGRDQGNIEQNREFTNESLAIYREFGTQWAIGFGLNNLAQAAYQNQDLSLALDLANEGVSLFRSIQNDGGIAETLITLGQILTSQGDIEGAKSTLQEALTIALKIGPRLLVVAALESLGVLMVQNRQILLSVKLLAIASSMRSQMGTPLRPISRTAVELALATARNALSMDNFTAVWSKAESQPLREILNTIPGFSSSEASTSDSSSNLQRDDRQRPDKPAEDRTRVDWEDALTTDVFYGREWELSLLKQWIIEERCRVISIIGLGGIGKSALAVHLMHQIAEEFEIVIWRSLRDLTSCDYLLISLLQVLAPHTLNTLSDHLDERLSLLMDYLRKNKVLLVLDNLETVLTEGDTSGHIRTEYEGFERFLRYVSQTNHQATIVLTSREKPGVLVPLEGHHAPVRAMRLAHMEVEACEHLLQERGLTGDKAERARLIASYAGNPLALKIVAQTIVDLFGGDTRPFLEQGEIIFGGIRELLATQFNRLSSIERGVLIWLAILREPATLIEIESLTERPIPRVKLLETVESLHRRSLLERGQGRATFTLQSVVLEYITAMLISKVCDEIEQGQMVLLIQHGLELAHSHEYIRRTQEQFLIIPILENLRNLYPQQARIEARLTSLLAELATQPVVEQGYGPANLIVLLRVLRGNLSNLDLSRLALRNVSLQGVDLRDSDLSHAVIRDSVFSEAFDGLIAVDANREGIYWAVACTRGEIQLWNADRVTLYRVWQAHSDMIWALVFSPDGSRLASGSWDGTVKLWDVNSGELLWSGRHGSFINSIHFSPDGHFLASSGTDATVQLWNLKDDVPVQILEHPIPVTVVLWNPAGDLLTTGDNEGGIRLWKVEGPNSITPIVDLIGHTNWVDAMAFSPDGNTLASASWDGTVKLWDIPGGQLRQTLTGHSDQVNRVIWSADGRWLASSSRDRTIWLWDVEHESYRILLQGHTDSIKGLAFMPDSRSLLSGSMDGTMRVWDLLSGRCKRIIEGYTTALCDIAWSPDASQLMSGGTDAVVNIYDVEQSNPIRDLHGHKSIVISVGWSPDGRFLASSEWDNAIHLWDANTGRRSQLLSHPDDRRNFFYGLAWSPDGNRLAAGTNKRGVMIFNVTTSNYVWLEEDFSTWIRPVAWSPDGRYIAGGGDDGIVYIWSASDGSLLHKLEGHQSMVTSLAWNSTGDRLASGGSGTLGGEVLVWDTLHWKCQQTISGHAEMVTAVAWNLNNDIVISGGGDGALCWWDIQHGKLLQTYEGHIGAIQSLKTSPSREKLASAGDDGAIVIWDLSSGAHLQVLRRDRPYERLNITGISGLTDAQKSVFRALGAVDDDLAQVEVYL